MEIIKNATKPKKIFRYFGQVFYVEMNMRWAGIDPDGSGWGYTSEEEPYRTSCGFEVNEGTAERLGEFDLGTTNWEDTLKGF